MKAPTRPRIAGFGPPQKIKVILFAGLLIGHANGDDPAQTASPPSVAAGFAAARLNSLPAHPIIGPAGTFAASATAEEDEVVHLPLMLVRSSRLPDASEVMTTNGMLEHYLGPKDGFDRGRLNVYTLHWDFGLFSVTLFGAVKNESRARQKFALEERNKMNTRLAEALRLEKLAGSDAGALRRDIAQALGGERPFPGK